jgi:hypothetical protein
LRDVWIRTKKAAVARRRTATLATLVPISQLIHPKIQITEFNFKKLKEERDNKLYLEQ